MLESRAERWRMALILTFALVLSGCGGGGSVPGAVPEPPDTGAPGPTELVGTPLPTEPVRTPAPTAPPLQPDPGQEQPVPVGHAAVLVYFVEDGTTARAVTRLVSKPQVATNAIASLLQGPTAAEAASGLGSAIPGDTTLRGITIEDRVATIDLTGAFESGGGITNIMSRLGQVVYTLTQFPTVDEVSFELDGRPVLHFSGEGVVLSSPVGRSFFTSAFPITTSRPTSIPLWDSADLAGLDGGPDSSLGTVALVSSDDVLNVRQGPGVPSTIVGMLEPGTRVLLTGRHDHVGNSTWVEIETPIGAHWVNRFYLAGDIDPSEFTTDDRVDPLIRELADLFESRGDLTSVTSRRGLFIAYNSAPVHVARSTLDTVLTDPTKTVWQASDGVNSAGPQTFAEAVADSFLAAYAAADGEGRRNEWGALAPGVPDTAGPIAFQLAAFNHVGYHFDISDVTRQFSWYVSVDYEGGEPRVVALTLDSWTP